MDWNWNVYVTVDKEGKVFADVSVESLGDKHLIQVKPRIAKKSPNLWMKLYFILSQTSAEVFL